MKICHSDGVHRCFHDGCDFIDMYGNVHVCKHHLNPNGRFMKRKEVIAFG